MTKWRSSSIFSFQRPAWKRLSRPKAIYDYGSVTWSVTHDRTTTFTLTPDDHPDTIIEGTVTVAPEGQAIEILLKDVPLNG